VAGVDLSRTHDRLGAAARAAGAGEDLGELRTADVLALPFPDNRFDVVVCESVLAFVEDKRRAIGECVRVTKPGGHVGLNEGLWLTDPHPGWQNECRTPSARLAEARDARPGPPEQGKRKQLQH
jgi:ubiquinone/menaquinone biosynthesis C-methylase UbiE